MLQSKIKTIFNIKRRIDRFLKAKYDMRDKKITFSCNTSESDK